MFKFGFSKEETIEENVEDTKKSSTLDWTSASEIQLSLSKFDANYEKDDLVDCQEFPGVNLKLIRSDKILQALKKKNHTNIIEAESQHSDLIPAIYEGGLKIWECTYDLGTYIISKDMNFHDKLTLDLGCGVGIIGLIAHLRGSSVHFQDYNIEVIESLTIPHVLLNSTSNEDVVNKCRFFYGDWKSFSESFLNDEIDGNRKYDMIFTCETIYNPDNHRKLYEVFKRGLKSDGIGFVAAKIHYFGVGGGMRQFENLVKEDGVFETEIVWQSKGGLQREILQLRRQIER